MVCDLCARTPIAAVPVGDGFPRPFLSVIIIQHLFRVSGYYEMFELSYSWLMLYCLFIYLFI